MWPFVNVKAYHIAYWNYEHTPKVRGHKYRRKPLVGFSAPHHLHKSRLSTQAFYCSRYKNAPSRGPIKIGSEKVYRRSGHCVFVMLTYVFLMRFMKTFRAAVNLNVLYRWWSAETHYVGLFRVGPSAKSYDTQWSTFLRLSQRFCCRLDFQDDPDFLFLVDTFWNQNENPVNCDRFNGLVKWSEPKTSVWKHRTGRLTKLNSVDDIDIITSQIVLYTFNFYDDFCNVQK